MTRARSWSTSFSNLLSKSSDSPERKKISRRPRRETIASTSDSHIASLSHPDQLSSSPPLQHQANARATSRTLSMMQIQPSRVAEIEKDTHPELQPIFNFLNVHSQKLYTEGYFLKLADLAPDGKPVADRSWKECFAQLKGTVLSLWDAVELESADQNNNVAPTFINLTDASIKMIDKMPTRSPDVPPLTNVLSISTAGQNRYLFHFNSHHSLVQWTAGIRLCMFDFSKLQEIYTGALIAAKGKSLNGIGQITQRTNFKHEDWVRVRFGAGTPWRRCWAVITQPDEKSIKKARVAAKKNNTPLPVFKGDIKFFDNKKSKKKQAPIATIVDVFAAYALYPQSKQLIDMSTLIKMEGKVRFQGEKVAENERYVFVMPDLHPAVSGFETMIRFLFPTYDTFSLYGRPERLIPDKTDPRSLMFAMPIDNNQQCGYLDLVDVVNVVVQDGSKIKLESEWRERLKKAAKEKMTMLMERGGKPRPRSTMSPPRLLFDSSQPDIPSQHALPSPNAHQRSTSEATGYLAYRGQQPPSPFFESPASSGSNRLQYGNPPSTGNSEDSSDDGLFQIDPAAARRLQIQTNQPPPEPVPVTPIALHPPSSRPQLPLPDVGSPSDNLFAGVVPLRRTSVAQDSQRPPSRGRGDQFLNNEPSQFSQRRSDNQMEAPPGFALQSSHILLRGPRPTMDEKEVYEEEEYANHPPPGRPMSQDYTNQMSPAPEYTERHRSWQPSPPSGSPSPEGGSRESLPAPSQAQGRTPLRVNTLGHPSPIDTSVGRQKAVMSAVTEYDTPDSVTDIRHMSINDSVLDLVGPQRQGSNEDVTGQDVLDRKTLLRMQQVMAGTDSPSEYGTEDDDDEPDYASSVDTSDPPPPKRDANMPRAGRMKVVGQKPDSDVVIGDVHYRPHPRSSEGLFDQADIPKVDFGMTISHGRSLSADLPTNAGGDHNRSPSAGMEFVNNQPARTPSDGSDWNRPSPESQESDSDQSKRRSMPWQPGIVASATMDRPTAERYVADRAAQAAAASQTRNRQLHQRKPSAGATPYRNQSTEFLPRPASRGPNTAFLPNGLVSTPDLSAHLSAREQEYVARKTGSTLLQMNETVKAPPHKGGLVGAIQSRETEKQMKGSWQRGQGNTAVQQEVARRQQQQAQKEQAMRAGRTPSPRVMADQGYFPQQSATPAPPSHQQLHQQQQQQQQQQMYYTLQQHQQQLQQPMSYGYPNQPQGHRTPEGYQNPYYSRN